MKTFFMGFVAAAFFFITPFALAAEVLTFLTLFKTVPKGATYSLKLESPFPSTDFNYDVPKSCTYTKTSVSCSGNVPPTKLIFKLYNTASPTVSVGFHNFSFTVNYQGKTQGCTGSIKLDEGSAANTWTFGGLTCFGGASHSVSSNQNSAIFTLVLGQ